MSKTISITIPDQLERDLKAGADKVGVSRSRFIGNILLEWQKETSVPPNNCSNLNEGICSVYNFACSAPQSEAITCEGYQGKKEN
jgi:metal-responsive CopG/Arc/MetJ family transcriptional regulator